MLNSAVLQPSRTFKDGFSKAIYIQSTLQSTQQENNVKNLSLATRLPCQGLISAARFTDRVVIPLSIFRSSFFFFFAFFLNYYNNVQMKEMAKFLNKVHKEVLQGLFLFWREKWHNICSQLLGRPLNKKGMIYFYTHLSIIIFEDHFQYF